MIDITEAKKGATIELDGTLYNVIEYNHIKMGRGSAQVRLKLRDIRAGHIVERTFQSGDKVNRVQVEERPAQYLYQDENMFYFMDQETFDQIPLSKEELGDALNYLKEGMTVELSTYEDEAIGIELPISVELEVTETGPGFKGDTATGGTKPATLETGITIQVPMFIENGEIVRVDTRSGTYMERA